MEYIPRALDLAAVLKQKSCFLFGPRQTGKSSLIAHTLSDSLFFNLLDHVTFRRLSRSPEFLRRSYTPAQKIIVIDEIQKLPELLNEVHLMIEKYGVKFLLTGSSARKLRRGGVNLLGGRAWTRYFHPFSFSELGTRFHLERAVNFGLIPSVYFSRNPEEDLSAYAGSYLQEEVAAEGLARSIPSFSRFLEVAALCNGKMINATTIASDAQVARTTVIEYFQILKDTLMGYEVPGWKKTRKRKAVGAPKFYFFDPGLVRTLQCRGPAHVRTPEFGEAFETFIFHELKTYSDYHNAGPVHYWRSQSGMEVDFILGDRTAVEVKASANLGPQHFKGLRALQEEKKCKNYVLVCLEPQMWQQDGVTVLPWKQFLENLWSGKYRE